MKHFELHVRKLSLAIWPLAFRAFNAFNSKSCSDLWRAKQTARMSHGSREVGLMSRAGCTLRNLRRLGQCCQRSRQTDRQVDRQTDKQTDRQTDGRTNRQTDRGGVIPGKLAT